MLEKTSPSMLRQQWLEQALKALRPHFEKAGFDLPKLVRVSIGWPKGARGGKGVETVGQCWQDTASSDKHFEIFIAPSLGQKSSVKILGVLAHELSHAVAGLKALHGPKFRAVATAIGLEGKMTATTEGATFVEFAENFIRKQGEYPAGSLNYAKLAKQSTRLIKCDCPECGYVARVTRKWIEEAGAPYCGTKSHGRMNADYEPTEDVE